MVMGSASDWVRRLNQEQRETAEATCIYVSGCGLKKMTGQKTGGKKLTGINVEKGVKQ